MARPVILSIFCEYVRFRSNFILAIIELGVGGDSACPFAGVGFLFFFPIAEQFECLAVASKLKSQF